MTEEGGRLAALSDRWVSIDTLTELTGLPRRTAWELIERLGLETVKLTDRGRARTHVDSLALAVALIRERRERPARRR